MHGGHPVDVAHVVELWLHTLAVLIALGYYGTLGRFVVPALRRSLDGASIVSGLVAIERRARPFLALAVILFIVTGILLMASDERYAGPGNVGASSWTTLMLVKHVVVAGIVVLGVLVDQRIWQADRAIGSAERDRAVGHAGLLSELATGLGALAILLTAMAG
jgi:uncharacterized membrane protein